MVVKSSRNVTVPENTQVPFNNVEIAGDTCACCADIYSIGMNNIEIRDGGLYEVFLSASGAATTAGNIVLRIALDGAPIAYTEVAATSAGLTDFVNLSICVPVRVPCSDCCQGHRLSVVNMGVGATFSNVAIACNASPMDCYVKDGGCCG